MVSSGIVSQRGAAIGHVPSKIVFVAGVQEETLGFDWQNVWHSQYLHQCFLLFEK